MEQYLKEVRETANEYLRLLAFQRRIEQAEAGWQVIDGQVRVWRKRLVLERGV